VVDGKTIGKTPKARTMASNGILHATLIKVTKDGYRPVTKLAAKELKVVNLVLAILPPWIAVFWIMGPESQQTIVMKQALPGLPAEFVHSIASIANQTADALEYDAKAASDESLEFSAKYAKLFYKLAEDAGHDVYYITRSTYAYAAILFKDEWYFFDITDYDTHRNINWLLKFDWSYSPRLQAYKLDANHDGNTKQAGAFTINRSGIPEFVQPTGAY
jgi:hypothetical protein